MGDMSVAYARTRHLTDLGGQSGSQVEPRPGGKGAC
jgi:hypothetical protein